MPRIRCSSPCLQTERQLQERPGDVSQLHPPPAPSRPADRPVYTHSLFCLHCDAPTKDTHLPSCVAKGLPPRSASLPPSCSCLSAGWLTPARGPSTWVGPPATPYAPAPRGCGHHRALPFARPFAFLWHSGPIRSGAPGSPREAASPWEQCPGDWRKALCAHLACPDFHPNTGIGRGAGRG